MRNFDETADLPYGIAGVTNNHAQTPLTSNRYGLISRYVGNKNEGIVIFLDALGMKGIGNDCLTMTLLKNGTKLLVNLD
jgi:hypothetical protein